MTIAEESPHDELHGLTAEQIIGPVFEAVLNGRSPSVHLTLSDLQVEKTSKGIAVLVKFRNGPSKEIRMSKAWSFVLLQRLRKALA